MELATSFNKLRASPEKTLAQVNRYGPPLVSVILVAVIAAMLASLTWTLIPRPAEVAPPVQEGAPLSTPQPPSGSDITTIVNAHIMGTYDPKQADELPQDTGPVEEYSGPLKLIGTLAADDRSRSLAVIEDGGEATVFSIGDTVRNGVTLRSVAAKEVVIVDRGVQKRLELPKADGSDGGAARSSSRTASRSTRSRTPRAAPQASNNLAASASKLGDFIRPQPVFANGKQRGYRVYPGRKREQFTALGLKPGDLVTEINGSPLDDPARGLEVFRSIASASQVSVTIERNGQPTSLVLDTSQLNLGSDADR